VAVKFTAAPAVADRHSREAKSNAAAIPSFKREETKPLFINHCNIFSMSLLSTEFCLSYPSAQASTSNLRGIPCPAASHSDLLNVLWTSEAQNCSP
jgi:hypothetical protein